MSLNSGFPRAFVAVDPEPGDRHALRQLQQRLGSGDSQGWLGADDLHLTLRFLGDIEAPLVDAVAARCAALALATPASMARPQALDAWPPAGPQVLVLTLAVAPSLADMQQAMVALPSTAPGDRRPWRPHITLRRGRHIALPSLPAGQLLAAPIACRQIALFARADGNAPARYRRIASWPLQGPAAAQA